MDFFIFFRKLKQALFWFLNKFFLLVVLFYQVLLSPFLGGNCRFYPSCSIYARDALKTKSIDVALVLIFRRLFKCQPFGPYGDDPLIGETLYDRK